MFKTSVMILSILSVNTSVEQGLFMSLFIYHSELPKFHH